MELKGTIIKVLPIETISEKFKKQPFVLEMQDGQFTQEILIEVPQAKLDLNGAEGKEATVQINLRGRRYERDGKTRWFNSIEAWKIDITQSEASAPPAPETNDVAEEFENDLPF
jgi:hypothetical protein